MILSSLVLQNFRSYIQKKFDFSSDITIVIGQNTAGKTNLAEAIHMLSTGKSFKSPIDASLIYFGKEIGRIKGMVEESDLRFKIQDLGEGVARLGAPHRVPAASLRVKPSGEGEERQDPARKTTLGVVLMSPQYNNGRFGKKYLINDIPKSRNNFLGFLPLVLFRPEELDIIIDGPSVRREFLNEVLEQVDRDYVISLASYERALRQRNALLQRVREALPNVTRESLKAQFDYWDELVIRHGQIISQKREEFINWLNNQEKDVISFVITYDHSKISEERLLQYKDAEIGAGVTLVGPHRDDFFVTIPQGDGVSRDVKQYGSRGQQRLVVLQMKLLQILYTEKELGKKPLLVLDDIFSELDTGHIQLVLEKVAGQQVIITTTHKEFIPKNKLTGYSVIELKQ